MDNEKYEEQAIEEMWARFDINMGLDVFGNTMVKLVDNLERSRIVFVDNNKFLHEIYLEKGIVDEIFICFYSEFSRFFKEQGI